jgi:DNA-directed RNA polymerase subunit K/omega
MSDNEYDDFSDEEELELNDKNEKKQDEDMEEDYEEDEINDKMKKILKNTNNIEEDDEEYEEDDEEYEQENDEEDDDDDEYDMEVGFTRQNKKIKKNENENENEKNIYIDTDNEDEDDEDDDEDDDDENYLKKFDENINKNIISEYHPELQQHNYEEIDSLCVVVRNELGVIIDPLHKTLPFLTKYEKARILGERAKQINAGGKPFIHVEPSVIDGYLIAMKELEQKKIPFIIKRPLPNGGCEYWKLKDLEILI